MPIFDGIKARIYERVDPAAKQARQDSERRKLERQQSARASDMQYEQERRARIRSGEEQGGIGAYLGSTIRERRAKSAHRSISEKLDPTLKEIRGIETRQKNRERSRKIGERFDQIRGGIDKFEKGKKQVGGFMRELGTLIPDDSPRRASGSRRSSGGFGFSNADLGIPSVDQLLGKGRSSGTGRKRSSGGGREVPIYKGNRIVGYRKTGGGSKRKRAKARSIFDIDI